MRAFWGSILLAGLAALTAGCRTADDATPATSEGLVGGQSSTVELPSAEPGGAGPTAREDVAVESADSDRTRGWSVEDKADQIIKAAGQLLSQTKRFSFRAETMEEEVLESGAKIDTTREGNVHVRRPNGLYVERHDISGVRKLYYDGGTAALLDVPSNLYVMTKEAPGDLDEFLDYLALTLDISVPLADVIVADPYAAIREPAIGGVYLGEALVRGSRCHHLGFGNGSIEWQVWVQSEGRPLIRKAVINYRDEAGSPRWETHLSDWNLDDALPDATFTFAPPEGSHRIRLANPDGAVDPDVEVAGPETNSESE